MTVRELIAHLSTLPQDVRVVVRGYEWGEHDVCGTRLGVLQENFYCDVDGESGYGGPHAFIESKYITDERRIDMTQPVVAAVKLTGKGDDDV